jgi:hypothetical protein
LSYGDKKLSEIKHRMQELNAMEQDMKTVRKRLIDRLAKLEKGGNHV